MIRPDGFRGAAFGTAAEGDARADARRRRAWAEMLGVPEAWATVRQVHGATVHRAEGPGDLGEGDGIVTDRPGLTIAVATADCVPVVVAGRRSVGVIHAGWRGILAGVVPATLEALVNLRDEPLRAAVGPAIGPCCYEVGPEVADRFPRHRALTTWGTTSVDLVAAVRDQLGDLEVWAAGICTRDSTWLWSHRRDATRERQVTVAWLPSA